MRQIYSLESLINVARSIELQCFSCCMLEPKIECKTAKRSCDLDLESKLSCDILSSIELMDSSHLLFCSLVSQFWLEQATWKILAQISAFKLLHNYSDELTVTGWITACPRPITNILAGTHVVSAQCVASITIVGGSCVYEVCSSWWLVGHHTICDGQIWTVVNYSEEWYHNDVITMMALQWCTC